MAEEKKNQSGKNTGKPQNENGDSDLRQFDENPYDPDNKKPEDIVRLFYVHNVPVIPVVSKRGLLFGLLKKEDLISELSDIERTEKIKIDKLIKKITQKVTIDDVLPYGNIKEFVVINIFGEVQGRWSRIQLFNACENKKSGSKSDSDIEKQREEQVLEWMIYLILEHIPRGLYALNKDNKTIFYNSIFEDLYYEAFKGEVDTEQVENAFVSSGENEIVTRESGKVVFFNNALKLYYEKVPMLSKNEKVGFLIFCTDHSDEKPELTIPGVNTRGMSLGEILISVERALIVNALQEYNNLHDAAEHLKLSRQSIQNKMKKYGINYENN